MIVHLNGWPGIGKFTVGQRLAERLRARFIHNHLFHDVAIKCSSIDDPERWSLYESVRGAAYATLAKRPLSEVFVMTNALCVGSKRERDAWDHVVELAQVRNVPLVPVVLSAAFEENVRRLESGERSGKLKDRAVLRACMRADFIQRPDVTELIELDVTQLSAEQAADAIADRLKHLAENGLRQADERHRRLKAAPS